MAQTTSALGDAWGVVVMADDFTDQLNANIDALGDAIMSLNKPKVRMALIDAKMGTTFDGEFLAKIQRFLPANYTARLSENSAQVIIEGVDNAGWTLDGYVIPRLASGLYFAREAN